MDSDGEDSPFVLDKMLKVLEKNKNKFVFASRASRKENLILKFLNNIRLIFTYIMTGKYINYGNFSCFYFNELKEIVNKKETFSAFVQVLRNIQKFIKVPVKKKRVIRANLKLILNF